MRQDGPVGLVFEENSPKLHSPLEMRYLPRTHPVRHVTADEHHFGNPFGCNGGLVNVNREPRKGLHRTVEAGDVRKEENYISRRKFASQDPGGAVPDHNRYSQSGNRIHKGSNASLIPHQLQRGLMMVFALRLEAFILAIFLRETLDDPNGGKSFLGERRKQASAFAR